MGPDSAAWARELVGLNAGLVLVGHTHRQFDLRTGGRRVVNPGSVGLPLDGDARAAYAVLERAWLNSLTQLQHRRPRDSLVYVEHQAPDVHGPALDACPVATRRTITEGSRASRASAAAASGPPIRRSASAISARR